MTDWKAELARALPQVARDPAAEGDILEELAQHCADRFADLVQGGASEAGARAAVLREFADRERLARRIRDEVDRRRPDRPAPLPAGRGPAGLARDLRYAVRQWRRNPGFTTTAVVTLALGIGATTAIVALVLATLVRPLPFTDPAGLVMIGEDDPREATAPVGYLTAQDWRGRSRSLTGLALMSSWTPTLEEAGAPERLSGLKVSWTFFRMLGVRPEIGRDFFADEDAPERWRVVLIGDALWRRRFGADPNVVGRSIAMNGGRRYLVVGVMPPGAEPVIANRYYEPAEIWAPLGYDATLPYACRTCQHLRAIGRLRAGVTASAAAVELNRIQAQLRAEHPTEYGPGRVAVVPLMDEVAGRARRVLAVLAGAVGFVLLVACANLANLLLARGAERRAELAIRAALGASRGRLFGQLLLESALLGALGALAGLATGYAGLRALVALAPPWLPRVSQATLDLPTLGVTAAATVACTLAFGLLPAWHASRTAPGIDLSSGFRISRRSSRRLRRALVVGQLATGLVLLACAVLMVRTVGSLLGVDAGFEPRGVLTARVEFVGARYGDDQRLGNGIERLLEGVRSLPGIEGAALASQIPLGGGGDRYGFHVEGRIASNPELDPSVERYGVTPDYFRVMRIPLRRGRLFAPSDTRTAAPVALVNETVRAGIFRGADPIGQRVRIGPADSGPWRTIVGVVGDVRHEDLSRPAAPQFYVPESQFTDSSLTLVARGALAPERFAGAVRSALANRVPGVPVYKVEPLEALVRGTLAERQFMMFLLVVFAAVAVILAAVGLYGVVAGQVTERRREIGVRMAFGATRWDIARLVLGSGLTLVAVGLGLGLAAALGVSRSLEGFLFGVRATDAATLGAVSLALGVVAVVAHVAPMLRASRVEPTVTLREP